MPAKRLPWFRLWVGATAHGKVRLLDDGTFRTWVELLDAAAQQPKRGRFASAAEAAAITRRPAKHVAALMRVGLVDDTPDGLVMHDWDDWQRWRKEDADDEPTPPQDPPNNTRTTTEHPRNIAPPLHEKEKEETERDRERDVSPLAADAASPPRGSAAAANKRAKVVAMPVFTDDEMARANAVAAVLQPRGLVADRLFWRKVLDKYPGLDLEAEAMKAADWLRRHSKRTCSQAFVFNWLDGALERAKERAPKELAERRTVADAFGWSLAVESSDDAPPTCAVCAMPPEQRDARPWFLHGQQCPVRQQQAVSA